jgi:preprotein translocase subunit SecA
MLDSIKREVSRHLMAVQIQTREQVEEAERRAEEAARAVKNVQYQHADYSGNVGAAEEGDEGGVAVATAPPPQDPAAQPFTRSTQKVGRNDPCPCGSGKKFKHCHGRLS